MVSASRDLWCPSGDAQDPEAVVLGVHSGDDRGLVYLGLPVPARTAVEQVPAGVEPTAFIRFAAPCADTCQHWQDHACSIAAKVVATPASEDDASLPRCHLRAKCRWWHQAGADACHRCSLVVTAVAEGDQKSVLIADPTVSIEEFERSQEMESARGGT